jgi:hypothetical protein
VSCFALAAQPSNLAQLKAAFQHPPDDARIMVRWWWFGPSVTKPELEREMRAMRAAGIGGFEVQPTYPLSLDGNYPYLSPEFLDNLAFVGAKAKELGLRMDLTLGSGWPFGGPQTPITLAAGRLRVDRSAEPKIGDGEKLITVLDGVSFISSRTRQTVKRPAMGAEGYVLDHYDPAAIANHLAKVGEPMLRALAKTPPYAIFSDSLEVYNSDWTPTFIEEFKKRRGYDITPDLPALAGNIGPKTADIRHDWGQTLSELADDNYLKPITAWAHEHGTKFRSQTYGIPPVTLSSYQYVDLPEGEGTQWRHFSATRWAASASHLYGRPVTSSETWTWLHSPVFRATPLDIKAEADLHFLQGINQLVGHGYPYSAPEAGEPGWRFYAAAVLNDHNPWWIVMPDVALYLQRVSYLLRQGQPANDVALYLPTHDAFAGFTLGRDSVNQAMDGLLGPTLISQILDGGYNFDFIDDGAIAKVGLHYKALVLPTVKRMPPETQKKIDDYKAKGGIVVTEIADLRAKLQPDLTTAPEIGFVHRKLDFADIYFVVNTSNHPVKAEAAFRLQWGAAEIFNPITGDITPGGSPRFSPDGTHVGHIGLDLAPYESRVFVFTTKTPPGFGRTPSTPTSTDLRNDWKVTFPGAEATIMPGLRSWTEDESRKYFSGSVIYERSFSTTAMLDARGLHVYLNFGEGTPVTTEERRAGNGMRAMLENPVREAAVVYINGKRAGSIWCPPYELNITPFVHPGENQLRIEVANTALNAMAKGPLPDYKALNAKYGERFQAQDMDKVQPLPAGLLGPVRLIVR